MAHLYKASIWQGGSGKWYCSDIEDLTNSSGDWWVPCRLLAKTPAEWIELLVKQFNVSTIRYNKEINFLHFYWDKDQEADAKRYKNWINAEARKIQFYF